MVLSNCYTISKSIATHDHLSHVVDSINDYESSSARNGGKITHDNLKQPRYRIDDHFDPNFQPVTDRTQEVIKKILSNTSIPVTESDPKFLPANKAPYSKKLTPHHCNSETTTFNPLSKHTRRKSHKKAKTQQITTKHGFWHRLKNKMVGHNDKTTLLESKIVTRKKRRHNYKNKKYKQKQHSRSTFVNRRYVIPVTRLEPSFFEYKNDNPLYTTKIASEHALYLLTDSTQTPVHISDNQRYFTRSLTKLSKSQTAPTTPENPTESQLEKLEDPVLNISAPETLLNKLKSNAFNFVWEEISGVTDIGDSVTEKSKLEHHDTKEARKGSKTLSSKKKNTTPCFITDHRETEIEHGVKSRTVQEILMTKAPSMIGCQVKHELKVIKNKMDDLDKGISCTVKCATHDLIEQTAKEMRELACKIEGLGKNMECKPPVTKPDNSEDHSQKGDIKKKNNIQVIHEYTKIPVKQKIDERNFMRNNLRDSATISDENSSKNENGAATSTAPTSRVKEAAISDKLFTSLTKLKVPSTTVSSVTITTPSSASVNKMSKQPLDRKATKGWHFTLPFTKEDFSMLRVLEDLLKNQPKTTTEISFPNVIDKPDAKQTWNNHKDMSENANKRDTGLQKHVTQLEHNDIPESSTIQMKTQDANSLLDSQYQGISANGVESWYRRHFLVSHGSQHSKTKFHTKQTVTLRTNAKKSTNEMRQKIHEIRCTNNKKENEYHITRKNESKVNKYLKIQTDKTAVDFKKRVTRSKRNNDAQENINTMLTKKTEIDSTSKEDHEKSTVKNEPIVDVAALRNEQQNAKNVGYVSYKVVPINSQKKKKKKKGWFSRLFGKNNKQKRQSEDKFRPFKNLKKIFKFSKSPRYYINDYINIKPSNENGLNTTSYTTNKYGENKFDLVFNQFAQEWKSLKDNNAEKLTTKNFEKSDEINKVITAAKTLFGECKIYPEEKTTASSAIQDQNKLSTAYSNIERIIEAKPSISPKQHKSEKNSKLYKNKQKPKQHSNEENLVTTKARNNENQLRKSDLKWKATNPSNYTWSYAADYAKSLTNKMPVLKWDSNDAFTAKAAQKDEKFNDDYNSDIEKFYNDLKNADEQLHKKLRNCRQLLDRNQNQLWNKRRDRNYYKNKQKRYFNLLRKSTENINVDNDTSKDGEAIGVTIIDDNYNSKRDATSDLYIDDKTHENSITEAVPFEYTLTIYWTDQEATQTNEIKISKDVKRKKKKRKKKGKTTLETPIKEGTANPCLTEEYLANTPIETETANDNTFEKESYPMEKATIIIKEPANGVVNEKDILENELENQRQNKEEVNETTSETELDPITSILIEAPTAKVASEKANDVALSVYDVENKEQKHEAEIETTLETETNLIAKTTTVTKAPKERDDNEKAQEVAIPEQDVENKVQIPETNNDTNTEHTSHLVIFMPKVNMKENPKRVVLSSHKAKYEIYYDDIEKSSESPDRGLTAPKASVAAKKDLRGRSRHRNRRRMPVRTRKKRKSNRHRHRKRRGMTIFSQTWVSNKEREKSSTDEVRDNTEEPYHSNEVTKIKAEIKNTEGSKPLLPTTELVTKKEETIANKSPKTAITKPSKVAAKTVINLESIDKPANKQAFGEIIIFPGADENVEEQVIRQLLFKLSQKSHKHGPCLDKNGIVDASRIYTNSSCMPNGSEKPSFSGVTLVEDDQDDLLSQTQRRILATNERLEQSVSLLQNAFKKLDCSRLVPLSPPPNYGENSITTQCNTNLTPSKITEDQTPLTNIQEKSTPRKGKLLMMLEHIAYNRGQPNSHNKVTDIPVIKQIPVLNDVNKDDDPEHNFRTQMNTDWITRKITEEKTTIVSMEEKVTPWKGKLLQMIKNLSYSLGSNLHNEATNEPAIKQILVSTDGNKDSEHNLTTKINAELVTSEISEENTTLAKTEENITQWKGQLLQMLKNFSYRLGSNSTNKATNEAQIKKMAILTEKSKDGDSEVQNTNQSPRNWLHYFTALEKSNCKSTTQSSKTMKGRLYDEPTIASISKNTNEPTFEVKKEQLSTSLENENEERVETKAENQLSSDTATEASSQSHDSNVEEMENSENHDHNTAVGPVYNTPHKTTESHHPDQPLAREPNISSQITKATNRIISNNKKKYHKTGIVTQASKTELTFLNDLPQHPEEENEQNTPFTTEKETTETTTSQTKTFKETLSENNISPENEQIYTTNKCSDATEENEKVDVKSENAATASSNIIEPEKTNSPEAQLTAVGKNEPHETVVYNHKNGPVTVPEILSNTKSKLENPHGHSICNTIIINFGPNVSDTLKTMLSDKSLMSISEMVTASKMTPPVKSSVKVSETITPSKTYTAKEPYLISVLPPKLKDLIWIPETITASALQRTINKRDTSSIYTAKDVDSFEILLDYIDTVSDNDSESRTENPRSIVKSNSEWSARNEPDEENHYKEKPDKDKTHAEKPEHNRNSIQMHIAIPYDKNVKRVAKHTDISNIRKIFSARMITPVDIEYQIHPYTVYDSQPVTENIDRFTRELYSIIPNDAKSEDIIAYTKSETKDNSRRLFSNNFEASTLTTIVSKCERKVMKRDYIKSINEDLLRFYKKVTEDRDKTYVHRRNKRSLDCSSVKGNKNFKRDLNGKEEKMNATKKDQKCRRRINWNWFKDYFNKNSRTCTCKFIPNKPMSKACAASDTVMTELISELEKMVQFMSDHCTEIQTFFWMNPSGGKKLRELVNKINKNLDAYYRRTKGSCKGQPCSSFKKKRDLNRKRLDDPYDLKRDLITTKCEKQNLDDLLADLRDFAVDLRYAKKYVLCGDSKSLSYAINNLLKETDKILSHNLNRTRRHSTSDQKQKYYIYDGNTHSSNPELEQRTASFKISKEKLKSKKLVVRPDFEVIEFDENEIPRKTLKKGFIKSQMKIAKSKKKIRKRENVRIESPLQAENSSRSWQLNLNNIAADTRKDSPRIDSFYSSNYTESSKNSSTTEDNNDLKIKIRYLLNILATTPTAILITKPTEIYKEKSVDHYSSNFQKVGPECDKASCNCSKIHYHCPPGKCKFTKNNCHCSSGGCNCSKTTCACPANKCTCAKHSELRNKAAKKVILDIGAETDLNNEVKHKFDISKENSVNVGETKCNPNVNIGKNAQTMAKTDENVEKNVNIKAEIYDGKHVQSKTLSDETVKTNAEINSEKNLEITADTNYKSDVNGQRNTQEDQNSELEKTIEDFLTRINKNIQEKDKINQQDITHKPAASNKFVHQLKGLFQRQNTHNRLRKGIKHYIIKAGDKVIDTIDSITRAGNKVIHKLEEGIEEAKKLMPNITSTVPNASYVCDLMATREYIRRKYNILQPRVFKRFIQGINCRRYKKLPLHFFVRLRDFIIDEPSEIRRKRPERSQKFRNFEDPPKRRGDWMRQKRSLLSIDHNNDEIDGDYDAYEKDGDYYTRERGDDYQTLQIDGNYDANEIDGDYGSYERNDDYGTQEREGGYKAYEIYADYDAHERDSHYDIYEKGRNYNAHERDGGKNTPYEKYSDYGTYGRDNDKYSSDIRSPRKVGKDRQLTRRYKIRNGHARKLDESRINKNRELKGSRRIENEGLFEKLYKGEDNVYRKKGRRQKRAQSSLEQFSLELENLPVVATDQDDLYVMYGEDLKINCIPRQSIDMNIKFRKSEWETSRPEMKLEANYKENESYISLTKVHSRNDGNYSCKLDDQIVREVRLTVITMPRYHLVFTVLYKTDCDCTLRDLKNIRYLGPVFSEASACGDKSVQIHEPVCLKLADDTGFMGLEDQITKPSSFIRATCSLSVCPEPVVQCGVNCVRDIHAKLVKLGAGNVTPLPRIPVTIQRNGVNSTLTPVIHKYKMVVTHKLRQDNSKLREDLEFHQLATNMGPGDRDMVVSCRAGYWLMREFMICAACPANMYSNQGDNKCQRCPSDQHSLPGSSHCFPYVRIVRDYRDHFTPKDGLSPVWQYFDIATIWQCFRKKCPDTLVISNFARNFYILIPAILVCIIISKYRCLKKKKKGNREVDLEEEELGGTRDKAMRSKKSRAKLETKESLPEKFLTKSKTQGSKEKFPVKSETQGIQVDPFPVKSGTQGVQVESDVSVDKEYKKDVSVDQEETKKYEQRRSCICGRRTCICNAKNRNARDVCSQEYETDGPASQNAVEGKSCRCKMPSCVCHKKNNNNGNNTVFRIWSYSSTGVSRKNKLSPSAVILARFFRPSTSSSLADAPNLQGSTSSRFEQWKEKNIPPPLPPIDFDSDSPT